MLTCGVVLVCLAALFAFVRAEGERTLIADGESAVSSPVPVAVANFPSTQSVTGTVAVRNFPLTVNVRGTVDVGNFPTTQNVAGTVEVNNLPLDRDGNLKVAGGVTLLQPQTRHFIGISGAAVEQAPGGFYGPVYPLLSMSRACQAEFPRTIPCTFEEISTSIQAPPEWDGYVLYGTGFNDPSFGGGRCIASDGQQFNCTGPQRVACCGF
jgi:hypothetical protein